MKISKNHKARTVQKSNRLRIEQLECRRLLALLVDSLSSTNDGNISAGNLSLREAIEISNSIPGPETIEFAPSLSGGTILTGGTQYLVTDHVTIIGLGATNLAISGGGSSRVFQVNSGVNLELTKLSVSNGLASNASGGGIRALGNVTLREVAMRGNVATGVGDGVGGAILSTSQLRIYDSVIAGNQAGLGGGVATFGSSSIIDRTIFENNLAENGGGFVAGGIGTNEISNSTFIGNAVNRFEGGAISNSSNLVIRNSLFEGNRARDSFGAGVYNAQELTVEDSTFRKNINAGFGGSTADGGGLANEGTAVVRRSTFVENEARNGGGIYNGSRFGRTGLLTVENSTISNNLALRLGSGGIGINAFSNGVTVNNSTIVFNRGDFMGGIDGFFRLTNSIVSGNTLLDGTVRDIGGLSVPFANATWFNNVISDPIALNLIGNGVNGNIIGINAQVAPLANNGGPTLTHALLPTSPAVNAGKNSLAPATDQRGVGRPIGLSVDVGAIESPFVENLAPIAADDNASVNEDTSTTIDVLANDSDPNSDTLSVLSITSPTSGIAILNPNGTVSYSPNSNFNGADSLTYTISDGRGLTASATIRIQVIAVNDVPVARNDSATLAEDSTVLVNALGNDTDADGDSLIVSGFTQGLHGTVAFDLTGTIRYTPSNNYFGLDSFSYTVSDGAGGFATATVQLTVLAVNDSPVAGNDSVVTNRNTSIDVNVLSNDSDIDSSSLVVLSVSAPAHGSATLNLNGTVKYTPALNYSGLDSFSYTLSDQNGGTSEGLVSVRVLDIQAPVITQLISLNGTKSSPANGGIVNIQGTYADTGGSTEVHTVLINWGDGSSTQQLTSVNQLADSFTGSHQYSAGGVYMITATVIDDGGLQSQPVQTKAYVVGLGVVGDVLYIIGTSGNDEVTINPYQTRGLMVHASFINTCRPTVYTQAFSRVIAFLGNGDDEISFEGYLSVPATIDAGDGNDEIEGSNGPSILDGGSGNDEISGGTSNDLIFGGLGDDSLEGGDGDDIVRGGDGNDEINGEGGNDILLGGTGNDQLHGGAGRDLLIGGFGADNLRGDSGEDILIGDSTAYDENDLALGMIMLEWTSTRSQAVRIANIKGVGTGPRQNASFFLNNGSILEDLATDQTSGSVSGDWVVKL